MRGVSFLVCAALLLAGDAHALYEDGDDVVQLTVGDFKEKVLDSDGAWLVEFYAPWCGHCKSLVPEWKKAATALKGIVGVGAVDMTEHEELGTPYGVTGFPSIKVFGADKAKPTDYEGDRTAAKIAGAAMNALKSVVRKRLGIKASKKAKKAKEPSKVVELTEDNFEEKVKGSDDLWLVEFFAPWCGHCKNLAPHWEKAAKQLEGKVSLGAVDATVHSSLARSYSVSGYPTIKVFPQGAKGEPEDWKGGRDTAGIVREALRLHGGETDAKAEGGEGAAEDEETDVVTLSEVNFEEQVLSSKDVWLVEFYAPWCGHCKQLAPEWKKAATELIGTAKLGAVDCTVEEQLCEQYTVRGFPTIKAFASDKKNPEDVESARTASGIVAAAKEYADATPFQVLELTGQAAFDECTGHSLCLMAFLPNILDTGALGRLKYLSSLTAAGQANHKYNIGIVWTEGFKQEKLESSLEVGGMGYPDLAVVNLKKGRMAKFNGQFSEEGLKDFVSGLIRGKERTFKYQSLGAVVDTAPWDGKGEAPVHQEL